MKESIDFYLWVEKNEFRKLKHTHPNKIGKWFSNISEKGFLTDEELWAHYLESK